jgi:tight adherence protein B
VVVAGTAAQLAVFLGAGLTPQRAWQALDDDLVPVDAGSVITRVNSRVFTGESLVDVLADETAHEDEAWRVVAAVHTVAHLTGAPLGEALWALSTALQERYDAERAIRAAILAPVYTQRLLMALPVLGLVMSGALGVNALGFLTGSGIGWLSLVGAMVLMLTAHHWSSSMVSQALPGPGYLSPALDLLAIASAGGASPEMARDRVIATLDYHGLPLPSAHTVDQVTAVSRRVGVPLRSLAKAEASWSRTRAKADAVEKASALSVKILIPLGTLVLPAFVLVAVVPVVFVLLGGVIGAGGTGLW